MSEFSTKILLFYKEQGRDLPWRHTTDRYKILVSEIMLQQTQVSRVIEKYNQWIEKFPTVKNLAEASLSEVLTLWSGLGYNSRGKRLWECAKIIQTEYNGEVPDTVEELIKLPGIGKYTSRSILIFADNKNIVTVDTNIRRILIHELKLEENISEKELFNIAEKYLPQNKSRDWHNALMDYGSLILTAKKSGIKSTTKQKPFKTSKRYYRGAIIKHLTQYKTITKEEANTYKIENNTHNIEKILDNLESEGLIKQKNNHYQLA
jgi:A/G-specific adenine glycosylase